MSRATGGYLRTLERMEKAVQDALDQTPAPPERGPPGSGAKSPGVLRKANEQLTHLEEALARAEMQAAGVENLLQTEAETFAGWVERLKQVTARLQTWAGGEK